MAVSDMAGDSPSYIDLKAFLLPTCTSDLAMQTPSYFATFHADSMKVVPELSW